MLEKIIIVALFTACILLAFRKWGWLDGYEARRKKWMPESGCFLCLGLWISPVTAAIWFFLWLFQAEWILIPFCAAPVVAFISHTIILRDRS